MTRYHEQPDQDPASLREIISSMPKEWTHNICAFPSCNALCEEIGDLECRGGHYIETMEDARYVGLSCKRVPHPPLFQD